MHNQGWACRFHHSTCMPHKQPVCLMIPSLLAPILTARLMISLVWCSGTNVLTWPDFVLVLKHQLKLKTNLTVPSTLAGCAPGPYAYPCQPFSPFACYLHQSFQCLPLAVASQFAFSSLCPSDCPFPALICLVE